MRSAALFPALLIAVSAWAQTATFSLNLTPENGGTDTRASWTYTGTPTVGPAGSFTNVNISGLAFGSGNSSGVGYAFSGSPGLAFTSSYPTVTGLNTGLVLTNTTTNATAAVTMAFFYADPTVAAVLFGFDVDTINAAPGQALVLSGPTSGSFLTGIAFSNFNAGTWTLNQDVYINFDTTLTVGGGAVPEPSTYGLALGGLALAVVAARRRASKSSK